MGEAAARANFACEVAASRVCFAIAPLVGAGRSSAVSIPAFLRSFVSAGRNKKQPDEQRLATRAEAVAALGLASSRVLDRLIERGAPGPQPGKKGTRRYDVAAIRTWMAARQARTKPTVDLSSERAKLAKVQRQISTLKLSEMRGDLVRIKEVEDVQRTIAGAVRAQMLAVPRQAVLGGLPIEHEPLVRRLITEALRDLATATTIEQLRRRSREDDAA